MRYLATESGLVLAQRERPRVAAPELWVPRAEGSLFDLPPMREPFGRLPKAEAFGVAGSYGTVMMASGSSVTPMGLFGAACKQWCRADQGITLNAVPYGIGTTIQAVTLTGSAAAPIDFYLEITSTGARGVAQYSYSATGLGGWIETGVVTSASRALIGACTGITVNFPTGTYTDNDVYRGNVTQWADLSGNSNHYVQPNSANAPFYNLTAFGSRPTLHFDSGGLRHMYCSSLILGTGNDQPFTVILAAQAIGVGDSRALFGMGSTSDNDPLYDIVVDPSDTSWGFSKRSDAGGVDVKTCKSGAGTADTNRHYYTLVNDGATQQFYIDGVLKSLTFAGDLNVGTATMDRMSLGARVQAAVTIPQTCNISEVWGIDRVATATELNAAHSYFSSLWSI